ncbi:hypothetical protein C8J57DRAFT_1471561 [Mycena rebaudengoi]|nr:hypothetical protein C8J57DRAFT_1471561 [Mycena rebaudengoi]
MQFKVLVFTAIALRLISAASIPRTGPVGVPNNTEVGIEDEVAEPALDWLTVPASGPPSKRTVGIEAPSRTLLAVVTAPPNKRAVGFEDEGAEPALDWLTVPASGQPNKRTVGIEDEQAEPPRTLLSGGGPTEQESGGK